MNFLVRSFTALSRLVLVLAAGCPNTPRTSVASSATSPPTATAGATASPTSPASAAPTSQQANAAFSLPELPNPHPPVPGQLRAEGYPRDIVSGFRDPADRFGYANNGRDVMYCHWTPCCQSDAASCVAVDPQRESHWFTNRALDRGKDEKVLGLKGLHQLADDNHLMTAKSIGNMTWRPEPLPDVTWAFGGDITLVVETVEARTDAAGKDVRGVLKIGGKLAGEKPVFVVFPKIPEYDRELRLNGLLLSPDAQELAWFTLSIGSLEGPAPQLERTRTAQFASLVLNDTGYVHHTHKEWGPAAALFMRAVYADPENALAAYNLACALAQQGDARAEHALRHAIGRDPKARERARKDKDFDRVKTTAWFAALTSK